MRKFLIVAAASLAVLALTAAPVSANNGKGPPAPGIYVDDTLYRTVGTPTDFSNTGAPDSSFDTIYLLANGLASVATAAPGDRDYNGGRWMVFGITWNVAPVQLTNDDMVHYYASMGWLDISPEPVKLFECPVIPMGGHA